MSEIDCHDVVKSTWLGPNLGCYMEDVVIKVDMCKTRRQRWSKDCYGNITKSLNDKIAALKKAASKAIRVSNYENVFLLKKEITELLAKEEKLW